MTVDEIRHLAENGLMGAIPKLFTISATGNLLIAGLSAAELISVFTAVSSLVVFWIVAILTIRQKRKANHLLDIEIEEKERRLQVEQANG